MPVRMGYNTLMRNRATYKQGNKPFPVVCVSNKAYNILQRLAQLEERPIAQVAERAAFTYMRALAAASALTDAPQDLPLDELYVGPTTRFVPAQAAVKESAS